MFGEGGNHATQSASYSSRVSPPCWPGSQSLSAPALPPTREVAAGTESVLHVSKLENLDGSLYIVVALLHVVLCSFIQPRIEMRLLTHLVLQTTHRRCRDTFGLNSACCWCTSLPQSTASHTTATANSSAEIELRDLSPSSSTSHSHPQSHSPPSPAPQCQQPTLPTPPPPAHCR